MALADEIAKAKQLQQIANWDAAEKRLADGLLGLDIQVTLAPDTHTNFDTFAKWAEARGCRKCPAKPKTIAAWVLDQAPNNGNNILTVIEAIEQIHDYHALSNPTRTAPVRAALDQIIKVEPPRSWPSQDKANFARLPTEIRQIISKRETAREKELRRAQNAAAELKKRYAVADEAASSKEESTKQ